MIKPDSIQKVLEIAPVEEVIGEFVTLKKRGANLLGLCPFHNERTPSFTVSPAKGIYKCFGCGAAGNSAKFIMDHEQLSFPEAIKWIAGRYNIEIEEERTTNETEVQDKKHEESLYIINGFAQKYFSDYLRENPEGTAIGLAYFRERGFHDLTIETFQLGFCPSGGHTFADEALSKGYNKALLVETGLVKEAESGRFYDFFRERVMFPIHNLSGKVIGFGGRTLKQDKKIPKYVNSPESAIYNKSRSLYGLFQAKNAIRKEEECILTEGYTDVLSLHQAGIENVVASSGTSLTVDQVRLLKRFTQNMTILYDGDAAGIKASVRGLSIALEQDMNVKIADLPPGHDPDSLVRELGKEAFVAHLETHKKDFIFYLADIFFRDTGNDPIKRSAAINEMAAILALVHEPVKRALYVRDLAGLFDLEEQLLHVVINKERLKNHKQKTREIQRQEGELDYLPELKPKPESQKGKYSPEEISPIVATESHLLRLMLEYGKELYDEKFNIFQLVLHQIEGVSFADPVQHKILTEIRQRVNQNEQPELNTFLHYPDEEISNAVVELCQSPWELSPLWWDKFEIDIICPEENLRNDLQDVIERYKLLKVEEMIETLRKEIQTNPDGGRLEELLHQLNHLLKTRKELADHLGMVVSK